jgi:phosphatidylglycerophosphatase A
MRPIVRLVASGLGTGYLPGARGTYASLLALLLIWIYWQWARQLDHLHAHLLFTLLSLFIFFSGVLIARSMQTDWGKDPPRFTLDELCGMFLTMVFVECTLLYLWMAFILFRFFDILKPFGIRQMEKVHGGWGLMLDDLLAAIYANLLLRIIIPLLSFGS